MPEGFGHRFRELFELSLLHSEFWHELATVTRPLMWPFFVGSLLGAALLAALAYWLARGFVKRAACTTCTCRRGSGAAGIDAHLPLGLADGSS